MSSVDRAVCDTYSRSGVGSSPVSDTCVIDTSPRYRYVLRMCHKAEGAT